MHVLITGVKGMLGADIYQSISSKYKVTGVGHTELDITNKEEVINTLNNLKPELVINCAAYTKVDDCEKNTAKAFSVNGEGVKNLATVCGELGTVLLQVSTDYVFDGFKKSPYSENDLTNPKSIYGKSKLAGEEYIENMLEKYFIVRTSWLFGNNGNNFVSTILRLAKERNELSIVYDQVGSPTYTRDLAGAITKLINSTNYGTYHITNSHHCSWYELAKEILYLADIKEVKVKPITTTQFNRPAPRPAFSVLENKQWQATGNTLLRPYSEALADYLQKVEGIKQ
ncbi:MAG: dTDP-4-dehydrorhamnose reductase [Firmicutes bacterium]|nr:dTDP-4-dehydrorhamnose reductase [Bacillota bacterium]